MERYKDMYAALLSIGYSARDARLVVTITIIFWLMLKRQFAINTLIETLRVVFVSSPTIHDFDDEL